MRTRILRKFAFDAAHDLPHFPEGHKCRNLHGHTYHAEVVLEGEVDPAVGYFMDYGDLKKIIEPIENQLDHTYLNDIPGLAVSTAENVAKWIYDQLKPDLPQLIMVRLYETPSNGVEYAP
ncbi:MAG: 6-carboxytetrahydropterin synthase QueD [Algisphaera sp.]